MQLDIFFIIAVLFAIWTFRRAWVSRERSHFLLLGFWLLMVLRYLLHLPVLIFPALLFLAAYWIAKWAETKGEKLKSRNTETLKD